MSRRIAPDSAASMACALIAVALALYGYVQPWVVLPSGPMTLNAFDLAEWASLVPAQRDASPPLVVPFLLRLQPVILSLLLGVVVAGRKRMAISALAICLLAAAQLPPFEFVYDIKNLNYRQQFALATVSLVAGFALLPLGRGGITGFLKLALASVGIVTAVFGLSAARELYGEFQLNAAPGAGIWLLSLSYAVLFAITLRQFLIGLRAR